ncbi:MULTISPECIES: hypothetical protein [unclassified Thioalkalivibrio]|uniref:hypothetical protein n=1 Tax=unclassified Thioalkalivibrio TaxID=2621013 RepID=UPI000361BDD8|nr:MULTISPECIES: hypothetical protein [unclassified Thioalkalivibrio]
MFGLFGPRPARQMERFRARYTGRSLIVHRGFSGDWLEELLKQPGGGGHFRIDSRRLPAGRGATPVEWLVQTHVLPLELPQPLFLDIREEAMLARHLVRGEHVVHPSEIAWFLEELDTRHHARLEFVGNEHMRAEVGIPVEDNEALSMLEHLGL